MAFRAALTAGGQALLVGDGGAPRILYRSPGDFVAFDAIGRLNNHGMLQIGAFLREGVRGIHIGDGGPLTTIVDNSPGSPFSTVGNGALNDSGMVAFRVTLRAGGQAFLKGNGHGLYELVALSGGVFENFCGEPVFAGCTSHNDPGTVAFVATLSAGGMGIFTGPDPETDKIIATGDPLFGSTVASFADPINVNSLNDSGQLAFIASLADGRRVIVRADPDGLSAGSSHPASNLAGQDIFTALVGATVARQAPRSDTRMLSNHQEAEGTRTVPHAGIAPATLPMGKREVGSLSTTLLNQSDLPDRVFTDWSGDGLGDMPLNSLGLPV